MSGSVTIGEFARLTHLSVPALRHYHDVGLLEPATVDTSSRYRRYDVAQVATAQLIRRLRELEMLLEVRAVLAAPDPATRDATVAVHLDRMERRLAATRAAVASLRELLVGPPAAPDVQVRLLPAAEVLIIEDAVARPDVAGWCGVAFPELYLAAQAAGLVSTGPAGGLYSAEFFERDNGRIAAFLPVDRVVEVGGRIAHRALPAARAAVAVAVGTSPTSTAPTARSAAMSPSTWRGGRARSVSCTWSAPTTSSTRTSTAPRSAGRSPRRAEGRPRWH